MKMSYAQNLEDYHLDLVFPSGSGTYVDVGGGHPVADNVSFWFYLRGWQGLVVEPQDALARLYAGVRPRDRIVSTLAGRVDGEVDFHEVEGLHGLSSMIAANADRARERDAAVRSAKKPVARLSRLIDEAGLPAIDFLKIDVEGAEADVLAGIDFTRHRPRVVLVEAVNPDNLSADATAWEPTLVDARYDFALFDGLNRFYVAREHADLARRLPATSAPWNTVGHLWDCGRVGAAPDHPDGRMADVLAAGLYAELPLLPPDFVARLIARGRTALGESDAALDATLVGTAEFPGDDTGADDLAARLQTDRVRAALGRIACMYDGGHLTA